MKSTAILSIALAIPFLFASCSKDDVKPVNEEEVITTVIMTLTSSTGNITLTSRDLDGDGPNAPVITASGNLKANTTYIGTMSFLNELESPSIDITDEIVEEGVDHQIFYQALPAALGQFTYTDADANAKPIGVTFILQTGEASQGTFTVTLRHVPNKNAPGVANGQIANAGGETDALISYPIVIEN
jgi:hypothetical protein